MAPVSSTVLIQGESGTGKELVAKAHPRPVAPARASRSSRSTAPRCPRRCSRASCSATRRAPSPARRSAGWAASSWPTAGPSSSTRSARSRPACRSSCCGCWRPAPSSGWAAPSRSRWTCGWWRPPTGASGTPWPLGEFRDDLYYRLNVLTIYLPPLRERREDIPLLVRRFVREFAQHARPALPGHHPGGACSVLVEAPWPGNVRQLRNLIESMVVLAPGREIRACGHPGRRAGGGRARCCRSGSAAAGRERAGPGAGVHPPEPHGLAAPGRGAPAPAGRAARSGSRSSSWARASRWPTFCRLNDSDEPGPVRVPAGHDDGGRGEGGHRGGARRSTGEIAGKAAEVLGIGERTLYRKIKAYELGLSGAVLSIELSCFASVDLLDTSSASVRYWPRTLPPARLGLFQ